MTVQHSRLAGFKVNVPKKILEPFDCSKRMDERSVLFFI
jgi:hypothetical protein